MPSLLQSTTLPAPPILSVRPGPTAGEGRMQAPPAAKPKVLLDPIRAEQYGVKSPFHDELLTLSAWQNIKLQVRQGFVRLPRAVWHGLKGDPGFTFSDFLALGNIPYYLGGVFLTTSFLAGRAPHAALRQGIGVALYYLGVAVAACGVNAAYHARTGVDPGLKYKKPNGDVDRVLASADFPRFDLLDDAHYRQMREKMGIPAFVSDPRHAVEENARRVIVSARVDRLILGNLLAALGAGYLAGAVNWSRLLGRHSVLKTVWRSAGGPSLSLGVKLRNTLTAWRGLLEPAVREKVSLKGLAAAVVLGLGYLGWRVATVTRPQQYESAGLQALSPLAANGRGTFRSFLQPEQMA